MLGNVKFSNDKKVAVIVCLASYALTKSYPIAGLITGGVLAVWMLLM